MVSSKFSGVELDVHVQAVYYLHVLINVWINRVIVGGSVLFASLFPHRLTPRGT